MAIVIKEIGVNDLQLLSQTEKLFLELFEYLENTGITLPLINKGEKLWMTSVKNTIGKYSVLKAALDNNDMIGFSHGIVKFLPDYLGGYKVGMISHFYVSATYRNKGIGGQLCRETLNWLRMQNVSSVEVEVTGFNSNAGIFWSRNGFKHELVQFRRFEQ
jgi:ribosomal protein S18 acetylase RimI-like enzyme